MKSELKLAVLVFLWLLVVIVLLAVRIAHAQVKAWELVAVPPPTAASVTGMTVLVEGIPERTPMYSEEECRRALRLLERYGFPSWKFYCADVGKNSLAKPMTEQSDFQLDQRQLEERRRGNPYYRY